MPRDFFWRIKPWFSCGKDFIKSSCEETGKILQLIQRRIHTHTHIQAIRKTDEYEYQMKWAPKIGQ